MCRRYELRETVSCKSKRNRKCNLHLLKNDVVFKIFRTFITCVGRTPTEIRKQNKMTVTVFIRGVIIIFKP